MHADPDNAASSKATESTIDSDRSIDRLIAWLIDCFIAHQLKKATSASQVSPKSTDSEATTPNRSVVRRSSVYDQKQPVILFLV